MFRPNSVLPAPSDRASMSQVLRSRPARRRGPEDRVVPAGFNLRHGDAPDINIANRHRYSDNGLPGQCREVLDVGHRDSAGTGNVVTTRAAAAGP